MRWLIATIALLFSSLGLAQDVLVVQINAKWNKSNTLEELRNLDNCRYVFGWLENQPYSIQSSITSLPVVVIYKDNVPQQQYVGDIRLKLSATFEEIQTLVNSLQ
jgi:hypothetical protein